MATDRKFHAFGWAAEEAVDNARKQIAKLIKADAKEIIFTSGATESDNLALKGVLEMYKEKGNHIITSSTEHRAVLDTAKSLEAKGLAKVTYLPVDKQGMVNPQDVRNAITDKTVLISIMLANNEIGTINPIQEIGKIAKEKGVLFHCDATQGVGKIPVEVQAMKEIALSSGSACTSATLEPSYVLRALGVGTELAHSSIRFGLGRFNTDDEIDYTIKKVIEVVTKLREMSPLYEMAKEGVDLKSVQWAAH